jgi:hypothetical protein
VTLNHTVTAAGGSCHGYTINTTAMLTGLLGPTGWVVEASSRRGSVCAAFSCHCAADQGHGCSSYGSAQLRISAWPSAFCAWWVRCSC